MSKSNFQWSVVHGLFEDAIYGGRIDDHQDILKIKTYLRSFFNDEVLSGHGKPALRKLCRLFDLPRTNEYSAFTDIISKLPETDIIGLLSLPANIDRTQQRTLSHGIISQLNRLRQSLSSHQRQDKWVQELVGLPYIPLWKKLTSGIDLLEKQPTLNDTTDPIISFFDMEYILGIELIKTMNNHFALIGKAIRGTQLLTNELQEIGLSLMKDETPSKWLKIWEGPENALVYMKQAVNKVIIIQQLREKLAVGVLFKNAFSLSDLYHPITFLNALRQQTSRILKKPMDTLILMPSWGENVLNECPLKANINGILIQGAIFDGSRLIEVTASDQVFCNVPEFQIGWVPNSEGLLQNRLSLPLYASPSRELVIAKLPLLCNDPETWILDGTSFFINSE